MADDGPADQALAAGLVQPDQTTCGSCVLVVARMLRDSSYAGFVAAGTGRLTGGSGTARDRFRDQALAMHRLTSSFKDSRGGWQLPWPTALGTQPWALAREMTNEAGVPGKKYAAQPILPTQRRRTFSRIASLAHRGYAVPLYVGNTWSPRHVVLVLPNHDEATHEVPIYDPASGRRYPITADDFAAARLDVAGWQVPWVVVVPT